jgi:hypothetical protein
MIPEFRQIRTLQPKHLNLSVVAAHSNAPQVGIKCEGFNAISAIEDLKARRLYKVRLASSVTSE